MAATQVAVCALALFAFVQLSSAYCCDNLGPYLPAYPGYTLPGGLYGYPGVGLGCGPDALVVDVDTFCAPSGYYGYPGFGYGCDCCCEPITEITTVSCVPVVETVVAPACGLPGYGLPGPYYGGLNGVFDGLYGGYYGGLPGPFYGGFDGVCDGLYGGYYGLPGSLYGGLNCACDGLYGGYFGGLPGPYYGGFDGVYDGLYGYPGYFGGYYGYPGYGYPGLVAPGVGCGCC